MPLAQFVYRNGIWFLVPIALFLLFPSPFLSLGFMLVPLFFLCRRLASGTWIPETRVNLLILILLTMTAIGFAISSAREAAVLTAAQVTASVAVFFFLVDQSSSSADLGACLEREKTVVFVGQIANLPYCHGLFKNSVRRVAGGLVLLGFAIALMAPFMTEPSVEPLLGSTAFTFNRLTPKIPKLSNPNIVAGGLAIIAPMALALIAQKDKRWRALGLVSFPLLSFVVLLLESRGALFGLAVGVAAWLTLYRRWVLPTIPLAVLALLAMNQAMGGPSIAHALYGTIGTPKSGTFIERQTIWAQSVYLIRESPIVGIGLGAYPRVARYALPYSPQEPGPSPNHAHNLFFQVALDIGIFGAGAFIALVFFAMRSAWRAYRAGIERDMAIGLFAALIVLLVHGLGDTVVWGTAKTGVIFWVLLSLGILFDKAIKVV